MFSARAEMNIFSSHLGWPHDRGGCEVGIRSRTKNVFSARAEMNRYTCCDVVMLYGVLRTRGDEPYLVGRETAGGVCSPHARR